MPKPQRLPRGVDRLPGGGYRARLTVDGYQHTIGSFATLGDARAALDIARGEKARGTFVPPAVTRARLKAEKEARRAQAAADSRTVRDMAEAWLSWQTERGLKLGSVYTYRRHLEAHFLPTFGDRPVGEVTALDLNAWLDALEESKGHAGAAQIHRVVAALFKWATGDAAELPRTFTPWLLTSPVPPLAARRLRRPNLPQRNRETLTDAELSALADLMPEADRLAAHLDAHAAPGPDGLLFPRVGGGNDLNNPNTVRKRFNAALKALNAHRAEAGENPVENFTWHGLRHTALTRLGQAGATTAELKAYAGHSDGKSVEVYQHAERRRLASLTAGMGKVG